MLLYGPPGTGKTMLAKAVANHTTAAFIRVVGSEFVQKYLGEVCFVFILLAYDWLGLTIFMVNLIFRFFTSSSVSIVHVYALLSHIQTYFLAVVQGPRMVRDVFRLAKENAPAIIFIDEVDAIATARFDAQTGADREVQRILMELLNQVSLL